jgi:hypothetical protein
LFGLSSRCLDANGNDTPTGHVFRDQSVSRAGMTVVGRCRLDANGNDTPTERVVRDQSVRRAGGLRS